jgi:hypothetical protein
MSAPSDYLHAFIKEKKKRKKRTSKLRKLPNFGYFSEYMGTTYFLPFKIFIIFMGVGGLQAPTSVFFFPENFCHFKLILLANLLENSPYFSYQKFETQESPGLSN